MIEDTLLNYLILYTFLELYEVQWQKANTLLGMLTRMYEQYKKSVFIFLLMHPTFYFAIMFMMITNYNEFSIILLLVKSVDILTKMLLIKKVFIEKSLSESISVELLMPLKKWMPYIGLALYLPLIYLVFV